MEKRYDWKEVGFEHFSRMYSELCAGDIVERCGVPYNPQEGFSVRLMGTEHRISHPHFEPVIVPRAGLAEVPQPCSASLAEQMVMLRYLCEGTWSPAGAGRLSYREIPWGETYFANFEGRCIKRLARSFGTEPETFSAIFENTPSLRAEKLPKHTGYRFEFMSNLFFTFIIWPGDEEFPSQAQILFDDNIPAAFTAEDLAVCCDIALNRLKSIAQSIDR
ncbi:MAG: DUF3786 domain-containing protein [Spirochaetaceae bacterium]|jgi:hypothetical protein|nr:DUF3786 domain-containing protein [Spirochaetaceae bacterium]